MTKTFFTSDTHFGHTNVIKFCNRPFKDKQEMDEALIDNWNSVVGPKDVVYHLGDFSFYSPNRTQGIINKLNGTLVLVRGNHDHKGIEGYRKGFYPIQEIKLGKYLLVLCHFPLASWNRMDHGVIHLHGHCHGNDGRTRVSNKIPTRIDVGIDTCAYNQRFDSSIELYTPYSLEQVVSIVVGRQNEQD